MDIFHTRQTSEEIARDELYASQKRAIDAASDAIHEYKMQTQTMLEIEGYFLMYYFRGENLVFRELQSGFVPV